MPLRFDSYRDALASGHFTTWPEKTQVALATLDLSVQHVNKMIARRSSQFMMLSDPAIPDAIMIKYDKHIATLLATVLQNIVDFRWEGTSG